MASQSAGTTNPTGENLLMHPNDYHHDTMPGASRFFATNFNMENFKPQQSLPNNPYSYLKNVVYEAQNCPDVVVAKIDPKKLKRRQPHALQAMMSMGLPGSEYAPEKDWVEYQLKKFATAREELTRHLAQLKSITKAKKRPKLPIYPLPNWNDEENWKLLCLGSRTSNIETMEIGESPFEPSEDDEDLAINLRSLQRGFPPMLRILLRMEQKQIEANLEFHVKWLERYGFSHAQGRWIYALLSSLEKPLYPTVISTLRDLSRHCAQQRCHAGPGCDEQSLNALNVIIYIIGKFFDQGDLVDQV